MQVKSTECDIEKEIRIIVHEKLDLTYRFIIFSLMKKLVISIDLLNKIYIISAIINNYTRA